jgi:hypothetical protein
MTSTPKSATVSVSSIVTTTQPVPAYGGVRLSKDILEQIAAKLNAGEMPMTANHDARRPIAVENVRAGVRLRDDGEYEVWADFDADAVAWGDFMAERDALQAPGGMSFTMGIPIDVPGEDTDLRRVLVRVAADAAHFSDGDLLASVAASTGVRVSPSRLYQFGAESLARVICDLGPSFFLAIPPNLISSYLYDLLSPFVPTRQGKPSILELRVAQTSDTIEKTVYLKTTDKKALRSAIEQFGDALKAEGSIVEINVASGEGSSPELA